MTVWVGTQTPFPVKNQLMQALRLPADKVRVITPYVGGGFGGKSASRQAVEAARLAVLTGKPVRVVFSREEEFFYDTFHPAAVIRIRSGLGAAAQRSSCGTTRCTRGRARGGAVLRHPEPPDRVGRADGAEATRPAAPVCGRARGARPGANSNAFARESHIDVMAAKAGMDPVEFRLKNLDGRRG